MKRSCAKQVKSQNQSLSIPTRAMSASSNCSFDLTCADAPRTTVVTINIVDIIPRNGGTPSQKEIQREIYRETRLETREGL